MDREEHPEFDLIVKATDQGAEPQTATANVIITLKDRNDNKPEFKPKKYQ